MGVMASQITSSRTIFQELVRGNTKETPKALHYKALYYWSLLEGIHQWPVDSQQRAITTENVSMPWRQRRIMSVKAFHETSSITFVTTFEFHIDFILIYQFGRCSLLRLLNRCVKMFGKCCSDGVNSLAHARYGCNCELIIFKLMSKIDNIFSVFC